MLQFSVEGEEKTLSLSCRCSTVSSSVALDVGTFCLILVKGTMNIEWKEQAATVNQAEMFFLLVERERETERKRVEFFFLGLALSFLELVCELVFGQIRLDWHF